MFVDFECGVKAGFAGEITPPAALAVIAELRSQRFDGQ